MITALLELISALSSLIGILIFSLIFFPLMAIFFSSFVGGPIWLWITIFIIVGIFYAMETYDKAKYGKYDKD